jgi:hypothetical protein
VLASLVRTPPNMPSEAVSQGNPAPTGLFAANESKGEPFLRRPSGERASLESVPVCHHFQTIRIHSNAGARTGGGLGGSVVTISDEAGKLTWLVGTDPLPGMPGSAYGRAGSIGDPFRRGA